jgi:hypothetical protein
MTPEIIRNAWNDEQRLVLDECTKFEALMRERIPGTGYAKYFSLGAFRLPVGKDHDPDFMQKVVDYFKELKWEAKLGSTQDMGGVQTFLVLESSVLDEVKEKISKNRPRVKLER